MSITALQLQAGSSAYIPMSSQLNSVYLAYSQDAVRRLSLAIAQGLRQRGYDVFMDTNHFRRFDSPPQRIVEQIKSHTHFVLLLTPASVRYGFNFGEKRLEEEIICAVESKRTIIVIFAFGLQIERTRSHWQMQTLLPAELNEILMPEIDIETTISELIAILQQDDKAVSSFTKSITTTTEIPSKVQLQAEYILDQGLTEEYESISDNRPSNAIRFYNQALEIDPTYADAYFQRADYLYMRLFGRRKQEITPPEALADYNAAIQLNPIESRYYEGRARLHEHMGNLTLAVADWTSAIQYAPEEAIYYRDRANLYSRLGNLDAALADYDAAIFLKSDEPRYFLARSLVYKQKHDYVLALADLNRVIELKQLDEYYLWRGFAHSDLQDAESAEADWNEALKISKRPSDMYARKAHFHNYRGELKEALEAADAALGIKPDFDFAAHTRDDVLRKTKNTPS